eukprot:3922986-Pyramimonas_sp.AAC.1
MSQLSVEILRGDVMHMSTYSIMWQTLSEKAPMKACGAILATSPRGEKCPSHNFAACWAVEASP